MPGITRNYMQRGLLPNMNRLMMEGAWSEIIPVFPTHTAANWNTVSTGAYPSNHGVTDMVVRMPGTPLTEIVSGFYSHLCQAEQIWKTAEKNNLKVILMKYIGSWPSTLKNGLQVEGFGAPGGPGSRPWGSSPLAISNSSCFATERLENATQVDFSPIPHDELVDCPAGYLPNMHAKFILGPANGGVQYRCIIIVPENSSSDKSPKVLLLKNGLKTTSEEGVNRKYGHANSPTPYNPLVLKTGQTSDWLFDNFSVNGKTTHGAYRFTLVELSQEASVPKMRLFVSQIFPSEGWTYPDELSKDLLSRFGPFLESISHFPYVFGWMEEDTYLADAAYQSRWMAASTKYLMSKYPWNLYMTQWHGIDNTQHAFLRFDKSVLTESQAEICNGVMERTYGLGDELVGEIYNASHAQGSESRKEDDIYTIVMSDHGHVMGKRRFFINGYLYKRGLIHLKRDEATKKISIDWSRTKAFAQGMVHVYVNVKGRDPNGCVQPGKEYEDLVKDLIGLLYDARDPKDNTRPIALALSNSNAEFIGLSGDRSGDIIVAAHPTYALDNRVTVKEDLFEDLQVKFKDASIHGSQLPSVDLGEHGTTNAMFIAHGPLIKKGYQREKPIRMIDVAPTVSHILGIAPPRDCEGVVVRDIFL